MTRHGKLPLKFHFIGPLDFTFLHQLVILVPALINPDMSHATEAVSASRQRLSYKEANVRPSPLSRCTLGIECRNTEDQAWRPNIPISRFVGFETKGNG